MQNKTDQVDVGQIVAFVALAEVRSFVRAAERLHLSQPAITKRIRSLEDTVGEPLFTRSRSGTVLTPIGKLLLPGARDVLRAFERFDEVVRRGCASPAHLSVGATISIANYALPAVLKRFTGAQVGVRAGFAPEVVDWVRSAAVDVGITRRTGLEHELSVRVLYQEELVPVALPEHPLAGRDNISPGELSSYPVVLYGPPSSFASFLDSYWMAQGVYPPVAMRADHVEAVRRSVLAGFGVGFLPLNIVHDEIVGGKLARLCLRPFDGLSYEVIAVHRPGAVSEACRKFLAEIEVEIPRMLPSTQH